ncbi:MAG: helix-turn-helix domain-containing protein [Bdellovibrionales bacterium]|nr:helix-turn-helix domain-containing protein [Bdellovibrionales bacterium]
MKNQDIYRILAFEESLFAKQDPPPNPSLMDFSGEGGFSEELRPYVARSLENDIGKFVALGMTVELPSLERVRHLIAQSKYADAMTLIASEMGQTDSSIIKAEFYLEESRAQFFTGNFELAIRAIDKCLSQNPITTSLISALQQRVGAAFELGDFRMAHRDLNDIYRFKKLFPHIPSIRYAEMFKIKILARTNGTQAARLALHQLMVDRFKMSERLDMDLIHVYLRCRNELNRLDQTPELSTAIACLGVAQELSDELYAAMDTLDVLISLPLKDRKQLSPEVEAINARFERSQALWMSIQGQSHKMPSQTALSFTQNWNREVKNLDLRLSAMNPLQPRIDTLVLPSFHAVINLKERTLICQPSRDQLFRALAVLANGPMTRELLFTSVWDLPYEEHRHETVLRTLVSRLRKILKLEVEAKDGLISLVNTMVLP